MDNVPIEQKVWIENLLNEHLQYSKSIDAAMQPIMKEMMSSLIKIVTMKRKRMIKKYYVNHNYCPQQ